ncbi:MAG: peptidase C39 [Planctomycetota bacterium]
MDLVIGITAVSVLCFASFCLSVKTLRGYPRLAEVFACIGTLSALAWIYFFNGWLAWAKYLPMDAAIIWTNAAPVLLSIASAGALFLTGRPFWRRAGLCSLAVAFALGSLLQPVVLPVVRPVNSTLNTIWLPGDVCQQSNGVTCSPAAAVTLLRTSGIESSEKDLIRLCLTDSLGTTSLGLWRGLRLATRRQRVKPEVMELSLEDLQGKTERDDVFPCLILVGFPRFGSATSDPETELLYTQEYGWPRGFRHSVVVFGRHADGGVDVGDPSIGRERWSDQDLEILWRGEAVRLVSR